MHRAKPPTGRNPHSRTREFLTFFIRLPETMAGTICLLILLGIPATVSGEGDARDLLKFVEGWIDPQDYVWSRKSSSIFKEDPDTEVFIHDYGRLRIKFLNYDEEAAALEFRVLKYEFDAQLPGGNPKPVVSPLEEKKLPKVWVDPIFGFFTSFDSVGGIQVKNSGQMGQIFELMDFRGFVPRKIPDASEEWTAALVQDRTRNVTDKVEIERRFRCAEIADSEGTSRFRIEFEETGTITASHPKRPSELVERNGVYWVTLPAGLIEAATWESISTEYSVAAGFNSRIDTVTQVTLARQSVPPPQPRSSRGGGNGEKVEIIPPR